MNWTPKRRTQIKYNKLFKTILGIEKSGVKNYKKGTLGEGDLVRCQVPDVPNRTDRHVAFRANDDPGQRAVSERHPEPSLRWELESSADEVADDVGMADDELVRVFLLGWWSSMEDPTER